MARTHLTDYLVYFAKKTPRKPALVFEGETISWSELWKQVEHASHHFSAELGGDQQQLVNILLTNSPQFVVTYLAVLHAGHIALPLDPAYKKLELDAIIRQLPPKIIITDRHYQHQVDHHLATVVMVDEILNSNKQTSKVLRLPVERQIASLTFTSGTTGKPKAVPNTHANHIWNIEVCSKVWRWTSADTPLLCLPLSHWYGLVMGLSGALYHGNTLYLRQQSFDANSILDELASGKISIFSHTPRAYEKLLELPEKKYNLSKVRLFISGSAPLPPSISQEFKTRFGQQIIETYGSSETGRIAANSLEERLVGSPGNVLPGVKAKLSNDGELIVKSPGVFPGYYRNSAATKASLTNDGWWRTGDYAQIKKGRVFLKGRMAEKIRKFGYTISPRDIEWALRQNPLVKDIYVVGQQQPNEPNDKLVYFIVSELTHQQITDFCKANLLFAWRPDKIVSLRSLPRTLTGKPALPKLKALAEQAA